MNADISNRIIDMRADNISYAAISKALGIHRSKISSFCNENGCGVVLSDKAMKPQFRIVSDGTACGTYFKLFKDFADASRELSNAFVK